MKLPEKLRYYLYKLLSVILSPFVKPKYINLYKAGRRVGNTTRLIDMFIQDFFNTGKCQIYDHFNTRASRERAFKLVMQRLYNEHFIKEKDILLDRNNLIIRKKLKNDYKRMF